MAPAQHQESCLCLALPCPGVVEQGGLLPARVHAALGAVHSTRMPSNPLLLLLTLPDPALPCRREDTERELHLTPTTFRDEGLPQRPAGDSPTKSPYLRCVPAAAAAAAAAAFCCSFACACNVACQRCCAELLNAALCVLVCLPSAIRGCLDSCLPPLPSPCCCSDVSGLTASLVRQALPCHFRITTGDAAGRASSAQLGNHI